MLLQTVKAHTQSVQTSFVYLKIIESWIL